MSSRANLHVARSSDAGSADSSSAESSASASGTTLELRPRLGFLGVGWIGRHRMEAIANSGIADVVAISDASDEMRAAALQVAPGAEVARSFDELLGMPLDGVVIATPSALHAEQSVAALERGIAVFCQKPLGRNAEENARVVDAARRMNLLLGVDLSYRFAAAFQRMREVVRSGEIGDVFAVDLVFHNAYGPDKPWFYDPRLSGGGCVMDLGIHLIDMALWTLGFPRFDSASSRLLSRGAPLGAAPDVVEDYAVARLESKEGPVVQLACSWNLPAGQEAVIGAQFYGTSGGAGVRNVNGSFYDFIAERYHGTQTEVLVEPPDAWGGRAAVAWAERLASGARFDPASQELVEAARVLDLVYGRA